MRDLVLSFLFTLSCNLWAPNLLSPPHWPSPQSLHNELTRTPGKPPLHHRCSSVGENAGCVGLYVQGRDAGLGGMLSGAGMLGWSYSLTRTCRAWMLMKASAHSSQGCCHSCGQNGCGGPRMVAWCSLLSLLSLRLAS